MKQSSPDATCLPFRLCFAADTYLTPVAAARIEHILRNSTKALHADNFPGPPRRHRYALDVFLFRPDAGFAIHGPGEAHDDANIWTNATAMCMAHRAYNGLPETVLHWLRERFRLERGPLGKRAPWAGCLRAPVYHCELGLGGVCTCTALKSRAPFINHARASI